MYDIYLQHEIRAMRASFHVATVNVHAYADALNDCLDAVDDIPCGVANVAGHVIQVFAWRED